MVDKVYAMSSFLQFRTVCDKNIKFAEKMDYPRSCDTGFRRTQINSSQELHDFLKETTEQESRSGKMAIALSGGIDSAILAKFITKDTVAYTFKCIVPGKEVVDESPAAKRYCEINGLKHKIIDIYWDDYEQFTPVLMRHKQAPIHSIEVQIYKAALQACKDGFDKFLFGELADSVYGGLTKILSKNFTFGEFVDRYSYVLPYKALRNYELIMEPFIKHCEDGFINVHSFFNDVFFNESFNSYKNACDAAGIKFVAPYSLTEHKPLDLERVRRGENKYLVREVFKKLYPDLEIPAKTPMPRPVDEWLENWDGPKRPEFWQNCHINMSGDQKYYTWILEQFLNEFDL